MAEQPTEYNAKITGIRQTIQTKTTALNLEIHEPENGGIFQFSTLINSVIPTPQNVVKISYCKVNFLPHEFVGKCETSGAIINFEQIGEIYKITTNGAGGFVAALVTE